MAGDFQSLRRGMLTPVYVAFGLVWLSIALYVLLANVIVRETAAGKLAAELDKLPPLLAKPISIALWCVFLLGWAVPLFVGIRRLFRGTHSAGA